MGLKSLYGFHTVLWEMPSIKQAEKLKYVFLEKMYENVSIFILSIVLSYIQFKTHSGEHIWNMTGGVDERVHAVISSDKRFWEPLRTVHTAFQFPALV